jgi:hypothetical protein
MVRQGVPEGVPVSEIIKRLYTAEAMKAIGDSLEAGIINLAVDITAQAKEICPVADYMGGNLKGSIQWESSDGQSGGRESAGTLTTNPPKRGAIVGTPVEYGVYQEFGTRKMNAQPFLRPARDMIAGGMGLREAMYKAFFDTVPRELKKV